LMNFCLCLDKWIGSFFLTFIMLVSSRDCTNGGKNRRIFLSGQFLLISSMGVIRSLSAGSPVYRMKRKKGKDGKIDVSVERAGVLCQGNLRNYRHFDKNAV
jgi:hypothetical protein